MTIKAVLIKMHPWNQNNFVEEEAFAGLMSFCLTLQTRHQYRVPFVKWLKQLKFVTFSFKPCSNQCEIFLVMFWFYFL